MPTVTKSSLKESAAPKSKTSPATLEAQIKAGRITAAMNFNQKVWALTARIPEGKVTTYAAIARKLNSRAYRAVGNALNKNPYAPQVPCHRVVGSDGSLTGFATGIPKKRQMLIDEGVPMKGQKVELGGVLVKF